MATRKIMGEKITPEMIEEHKAKIRALIEENGMRVHTILRHVSSSGMYREISPVVVCRDGSMRHIAYSVAIITGFRYVEKHGHSAIGISGCGMDMGFDVVYNLSSYLYPNEERGAYKIRQEWI